MTRWLVVWLALLITPAWAGDLGTDLARIQHRWAEIQYRLPEGDRASAFEALAKEAGSFLVSVRARMGGCTVRLPMPLR